MQKIFLATVSLAALLALPAKADLAAGQAAFEQGDYAKALSELQPLADGDKEAAFLLATLHRNGWGVPASWPQAARWYRAAGSRGHAAAQFEYAAALEFGRGVVLDRKEAYDWYLKAAKQGHASAMTQVGRYHLQGIHRPANFLEARKWLGKAAEEGDAEAQAMIDEILRKNSQIIDIPGSANPTEEAAQRILGEVKDLIAPLIGDGGGGSVRIGHPPTIMKGEDGHVVVLPMVEVAAMGGDLIRLGNVKISFAPDGEDYAIKVAIPARASLVGQDKRVLGNVNLGKREIVGRWSTTLHTLTDYAAELTDVRLTMAHEPMTFSIASITGNRSFKPLREGHYDVVEKIQAKELRAEYEAEGRRYATTLGGIEYMLQYMDLDVVAVSRVAERFGIDWRTGVAVRSLDLDQLPETFPPMLRDMLVSFQATGLVVTDSAGARLGGFDKAEMSFGGANMDQALSALSLNYAHERLAADGPGGDGVPGEMRVALSANRMPLSQMASATMSSLRDGLRMGSEQAARLARRGDMQAAVQASVMAPITMLTTRGAAALNEALSSAQAELRINEVTLKAEGYELAMAGQFRPTAAGLTGQIDLRLAGAERFAQAMRDGEVSVNGFNPADLLPAHEMAVQDAVEGGRKADFYRIALRADGSMTVNGKPLSDKKTRR